MSDKPIAETAELRPGTRVRVRRADTRLLFESRTGWVVWHYRWDGQYLVHLDRPARLVHPDGRVEQLPEICEVAENLEPVE